MVKVAMVVSNNPKCGITTHAEYLTREMGDDCEVDIIKTDLEVIRMGGLLKQYHYYKDLAKNLSGKYDVIHIQHEYGLWGRKLFYFHFNLWNFLRFTTIPIVMSLHSVVPSLLNAESVLTSKADKWWKRNKLFYKLKYSVYKFMLSEIYQSKPHFILHSTYSADLFLQSGGNGQVTVLPLGVPMVKKVTLSDKLNEKQKKQLLGKQIIVLFGFVSPYKGHEVAINALKKMPENTVLVIAGGSHPLDTGGKEYMHKIITLAHRLNLRDRVIITGFLNEEQVDEWQMAADIVIAPYTDEGLSASGAISRAFSLSNIVVGSDIPAFVGLAEQTEAVRIVAKNDDHHLAKVVQDLFENRNLMRKLRQSSHEFAQQNSMKRIAQSTVEIYKSIISQSVQNNEIIVKVKGDSVSTTI